MRDTARFARRVFTFAGVYGLLTMLPLYALEERIGRDTPPAITHPEYYYGFIGITVAWQLLFLVVARAPERLRPVMPAAVVEKLAFGVPALALFARHRIPTRVLGFGSFDLVLAVLFVLAYRRTAEAPTAG